MKTEIIELNVPTATENSKLTDHYRKEVCKYTGDLFGFDLTNIVDVLNDIMQEYLFSSETAEIPFAETRRVIGVYTRTINAMVKLDEAYNNLQAHEKSMTKQIN